jgi:hypothetical protein
MSGGTRWRALAALGAALLGPFSAGGSRSLAATIRVDARWERPVGTSRTTATLQVVPNPLFRRGSPVHDAVFAALRALRPDGVRYVHWLPHPKLAVAALEPPTERETSWDFSLIDPLVTDFMEAVGGAGVTINFSVIPQWMFITPEPVRYPADPDEITWTYQQGTELRDASRAELARYYASLVGWYTNGGFVDERGRRRESGHRYRFAFWEVLNEANTEHETTAAEYTARYDAIVSAIRRIAPDLRFAGPALAFPMQSLPFLEYFLDPRNHQPPDIPIDMLTYHFYAFTSQAQRPRVCPSTAFGQNDKLLDAARRIEALRGRLRPGAGTAINELGALATEELAQGKPGYTPRPIRDSWWNLSAAVFAHQYATLATLGVDVVAQSALAQYPRAFPSASMLDWTTGRPNARYRALRLLRDHFGPGDTLVDTESESAHVHAQAFLTRGGERKILLVNKCDRPFDVSVAGAGTLAVEAVDQKTGGGPPVRAAVPHAVGYRLGGFGVAVLTLGG